ncbi:MAG TPA: SRPBCC family protein [Longimicrobium sp.]|nr:SRPBCC family protein [Longimicrobium sp.]
MSTSPGTTGPAPGASDTADREIVLQRVFDAPRELVYRAWTEPDHLRQWFGPNGFHITTHEVDIRVGGVLRFTMHGPDGTDYPNWMRYTEMTPPARLVYDHGGDAPGDEPNFRVTVTFDDQGGRTAATMRMVFPNAAARDATTRFGAVELGYQTMEKLAAHLAKM